ncbi:hypothetical protein RIF29_09996 [Crotalaria pallida]|uniref:Ubiquitin-like protease family profile domain-containing protein n=1 Tax=Crotalaria pallida TaxID=3830 RepID=A0AAN9FZU9_CROPI
MNVDHSNDCGVWVAKWMIECGHKDGYDKIVVGSETRLRVAIDLILHRFNNVKDLVIQKASQYWQDLHKTNKRK